MLWVFILFCLWLKEGCKSLCFKQKLLLNHSLKRLNKTQFKKKNKKKRQNSLIFLDTSLGFSTQARRT